MAQLKLTRNEVLDLAVANYITRLCDEMKEHHTTMHNAQNELREVEDQIKDHAVNLDKYEPMTKEMGEVCSKIAKKHGFGPLKFEIRNHCYGRGPNNLTLQMGGKVSKDVTPRKEPKRLREKADKLRFTAETARNKGIEAQNRVKALERNKSEARQAMLMEIAKNEGVMDQINELVGVLVEAKINAD